VFSVCYVGLCLVSLVLSLVFFSFICLLMFLAGCRFVFSCFVLFFFLFFFFGFVVLCGLCSFFVCGVLLCFVVGFGIWLGTFGAR